MTWLVALPFALCAALLAQSADKPAARSVNEGRVQLEGVPVIPRELVERLRPYGNVRRAALVDWTADGESLLIVTRFGMSAQLHRVDAPLGARTQLSFFDEAVRDARRRPRSESVLFAREARGSAFDPLQLVDLSSGKITRLTTGDTLDSAPVWSPDGRWLAFRSSRRDGESNDIWLMDPDDPDDVRLVFEAPDGALYAPADFSPDGRRLLIEQTSAANDSRVHLLDLSNGESELVAGGGLAPGSYLGISPRFTRDGRGFFLASDEAGEFRQLARQDLESGRRELLSDELPWDVEHFELSGDGKRAAVSFNVNGLSRLYILETATRLLRPVPEVAERCIAALRFSPDARRLALELSDARSPGDVYVLDVGDTLKLTRWTNSEVGGLDASSFTSPELIHYPTFDSAGEGVRRIPAFVWKPRGKGPFPVVIALHAGVGAQARPLFCSTQQAWITELGAAVIAPNVRGSQGYGNSFSALDDGPLRQDAVRDVAALLDWIERQPDLDHARVALHGSGYGGYLALATAVHHSARLRAVIEVAGIGDFVNFLENTRASHRELWRAELGDERVAAVRAQLEALSPWRQLEEIGVPLFVAHGRQDPHVPVSEAERIVNALRDNGRDVWSLLADDEAHGLRRPANRELFLQASVLFLQQRLLPER
ncbi:MAG: peptidase S9 family protein [Planctomycetota bacterium]|nr:MAG: peptidase S9 family protein [Planctomycetota bacterium]